MGMGEAFSTVMKKYATFSGRARRSEFWWFYLAMFLIELPFVIALVVAMVGAIDSDLMRDMQSGGRPTSQEILDGVDWRSIVGPLALTALVGLVFLLPFLAVMVRRLHDMGQTGWWASLVVVGNILSAAPVLGMVGLVPMIMCIIDGQPHENRYGPDPKAGERVGWGHTQAAPPSGAPLS